MSRISGSPLADVAACAEDARPTALRAALDATCFVLALIGQAQAMPGDLDTTFSDDAKQTIGADFALARYNVDGTLDSSFAGDGKQTIDFGGDRGDGARAVGIQDDGKIVVAGSSNGSLALARLNIDGTLDSSFSGDGKQTVDFAGVARGLAIQDDGKIVVAGSTEFPGDFAVARYNVDGTLDSSFAGGGQQTADFGGVDTGTAVALQDDGKIVVAGSSRHGLPISNVAPTDKYGRVRRESRPRAGAYGRRFVA